MRRAPASRGPAGAPDPLSAAHLAQARLLNLLLHELTEAARGNCLVMKNGVAYRRP
jgi:hypothetical protein